MIRQDSQCDEERDAHAACRRELAEFANLLTHDLRAPLRAVRSLVDWLTSDYKDKFDDEGRKRLSLLASRVAQMKDVVEKISRYSEPGEGTGRGGDWQAEVDLRRIAEKAIEAISIPKNVSVVIETALPRIACDPVHIEPVFHSLVLNAVEACDKPRGLVRVGATDEASGRHILYFADNGPGMSEALCQRVAAGVSGAIAMPGGLLGVGLALAVAMKTVERAGGELRAESTLGEGRTFFFTLPKEGAESPCLPRL